MVSKEERAELAKLAAEAAKQGWNFSDPGDLGFADYVPLIAAAVNAAPKLLDALDASDERIVELETEQGELRRALATAREDASEMEKKAIAEGSEALALRAEVAALKAAAQWRKMEDAPRDGTWIIAETDKDAMADLSRPMCRYLIIKSVHRGWVTTENTLVDTFLFARWLPIPGDGQ